MLSDDVNGSTTYSQEELVQRSLAHEVRSFQASSQDDKPVNRLGESAWRRLLTEHQRSLRNEYCRWLYGSKSPFYVGEKKEGKTKSYCDGLIDRTMSVLRIKGRPTHHSNERVNRHLNATSYHDRIQDMSKPDIAHHLFDEDTVVYYVSNSSRRSSTALLGFDIDAKEDEDGKIPTDALEQAEAVVELMAWRDHGLVQPSTSGHGAYVYFLLEYVVHEPVEVNRLIKDFCAIVKSRLSSRFDSNIEAIKGDIPVIQYSNNRRVIQCQGNLLRLPVIANENDLDALRSLRPVLFSEIEEFVGINGDASVLSSGEEEPALPHSLSGPPSSSTGDTSGREMSEGLSESHWSSCPLKRVTEGLKDFRDAYQRDPSSFDEFNSHYESLGLNTGAATKDRRIRYEMALKQLGAYRSASQGFALADYDWLDKYINEDALMEFGRQKKRSLRIEELKVCQYVVGLATAHPQKGSNDFGCPMTRFQKMHDALFEEGILSRPYHNEQGRKRYGCYVSLLIEHGLVVEVWQENSRAHRARRLVVTEKDEVFGTIHGERILEGRKLKSRWDGSSQGGCSTEADRVRTIRGSG